MTAVLPRTPGRHRAPETDEPRWATPAEFAAAWARVGRHAAPEPSGRHAADDAPGERDVFDWLGFAPAAG
ncbi:MULTISPECIES: hypothetical protein [unclassified Blastococcus]